MPSLLELTDMHIALRLTGTEATPPFFKQTDMPTSLRLIRAKVAAPLPYFYKEKLQILA